MQRRTASAFRDATCAGGALVITEQCHPTNRAEDRGHWAATFLRNVRSAHILATSFGSVSVPGGQFAGYEVYAELAVHGIE